jgi:hypothetical protein
MAVFGAMVDGGVHRGFVGIFVTFSQEKHRVQDAPLILCLK